MRRELSALLDRVRAAFQDAYSDAPTWLAWAPGRINLIGEHTDYTGGLAMPAAINRWVVAAFRPRADRAVRVASLDLAAWLRFDLDDLPAAPQGWERYAVGAAALFDAWTGGQAPGLDIALLGDVPLGAGLSSSAAVEGALLNGMRAVAGASLSDLALIRLGQQVEHRFLRLSSGLLDQFASQLSQEGQVLVVDFRDLSHRAVPATLGPWAWVVADSGVRRELASSAYEERVRECAEGLAALQAAGHPLRHHRELVAEHLASLVDPRLRRRMRHLLTENARVEAAAARLARGEAAALGALLSLSHRSLALDYEVSCPELDRLVEVAEADPRCAGARMLGGGFGGCVLCLVEAEGAEALRRALSQTASAAVGRPCPAWRLDLVGGAGATPA